MARDNSGTRDALVLLVALILIALALSGALAPLMAEASKWVQKVVSGLGALGGAAGAGAAAAAVATAKAKSGGKGKAKATTQTTVHTSGGTVTSTPITIRPPVVTAPMPVIVG